MKILVLNGVNLGLLGRREPTIYGTKTLRELNRELKTYAAGATRLSFFQTDSESRLIKKLHRCRADGIILNAGAYSHYSYALRDAVDACGLPVVETHLSDITSREPFRKVRVLDGVVAAAFWGEGIDSYKKALDFLLSEKSK